MWPRSAWSTLYEPLIRRAAGLGRAPARAGSRTATRSAMRTATCWSWARGPAGLAAARAAADAGARVILCDEQAELGGALLDGGPAHIDGLAAGDWLARTIAALAANPRVRLLARTTAFGYFPHNTSGSPSG